MKTDLEDDLAAEPNPVATTLDNAPDTERWDPILGSEGIRKPALHGEDDDSEDDDGRPQGAVLVETGVEAAEYDQMLESERADPELDTDETPDEEDLDDENIKMPNDEDPNEISEADADMLSDDETEET